MYFSTYLNDTCCGVVICIPALFSNSVLPYSNNYGDGYSKSWIFFPSEDGVPFYVDLMDTIKFRQLVESSYSIQFRLYTRMNSINYILLDKEGIPVNHTTIHFTPGVPIKVVTHGWKSSANKHAVINIKNQYLRAADCYVIGVDWSETADNLAYPTVAAQTKIIGNIVGEFLNALHDRYQVTGDQLHLIGHSLGAHVMGNAASGSNLRIARITGLDPARPLFETSFVSNNLKLDSTDAEFVDAIHTCSAILGYQDPVGHADFYPNSGYAPQPGCQGIQAMFEACSHSRSHFLFAESIGRPDAFPSKRCSKWEELSAGGCDSRVVVMGAGCDPRARGSYYLTTNSAAPFGRRT